MCILAFIVKEDYVLTVCRTKMDKVRPWKPKDGDNFMGRKQGWRLNTNVLPLVLFSDCKMKSSGVGGDLQEQSKVVVLEWWQSWIWNKLECSVNLSWLRWGKTVLMWTTHSSFTTQSNCLNMFTRNSTTLKHYVSVQMAEPILSLCCMQIMCLVKIFSVNIHVHFMFETLVSSPGPVAFQFLDVSVWTPVLPFV